MITALFITIYLVIALTCVGLGFYLSYPGHTMFTLPNDALNLLRRRSRPASTPVSSPVLDEIHVRQAADAFDAATEHRAVSPVSAEQPSEAEPAEAVHDEP